jgi:hypothetical protein
MLLPSCFFKNLSTCKFTSHCLVVMTGFRLPASLQFPSRTFKFLLSSAPNTLLETCFHSRIQLVKFIALSVLLLRYESSHECQSLLFCATVNKFRGHYIPSSASFPNHRLFGKSRHKSTSQGISFTPIPFFIFLLCPTIFFSKTAM